MTHHLPPDVPVGTHSKNIDVESRTDMGLLVTGYAELCDCGAGWHVEEVHPEGIYWDNKADAREQFRWWQDDVIGYVVREPEQWQPDELVDDITAGWLMCNDETKSAILDALQRAAEDDIDAERKRPF